MIRSHKLAACAIVELRLWSATVLRMLNYNELPGIAGDDWVTPAPAITAYGSQVLKPARSDFEMLLRGPESASSIDGGGQYRCADIRQRDSGEVRPEKIVRLEGLHPELPVGATHHMNGRLDLLLSCSRHRGRRYRRALRRERHRLQRVVASYHLDG